MRNIRNFLHVQTPKLGSKNKFVKTVTKVFSRITSSSKLRNQSLPTRDLASTDPAMARSSTDGDRPEKNPSPG